jgi:hypothetical protein
MYIKEGDSFWPVAEENMDIHKTLGPHAYEVMAHPQRGFYLQKVSSFQIPAKLYGDIDKTSERILNTYSQRKGTTGVLLDGLKGSGKTMLAKLVSAKAAERLGIPTILVGAAYGGPAFIKLLKDIGESVLIFDEFEKLYDNEKGEQNELLSLFDGVFTSRSLILVTCNSSYRVSEFFKNRPGRIYYSLHFDGLGADFIKDYCEDRLNEKKYISKIQDLAGLAGNYSFDMLQALVEEMNRYKESPVEAMKFLGFKSDFHDHTRYNVTLTFRGQVYDCVNFHGHPLQRPKFCIQVMDDEIPEGILAGSPFAKPARVEEKAANSQGAVFLDPLEDDDDDDSDGDRLWLNQSMLTGKDHITQTYTYQLPSGAVVVLALDLPKGWNHFDAL